MAALKLRDVVAETICRLACNAAADHRAVELRIGLFAEGAAMLSRRERNRHHQVVDDRIAIALIGVDAGARRTRVVGIEILVVDGVVRGRHIFGKEDVNAASPIVEHDIERDERGLDIARPCCRCRC